MSRPLPRHTFKLTGAAGCIGILAFTVAFLAIMCGFPLLLTYFGWKALLIFGLVTTPVTAKAVFIIGSALALCTMLLRGLFSK